MQASWPLGPALCFLLVDTAAASMCAGPQGWTALAENLTAAAYDAAMIPDDTRATAVAVQLYVTSLGEINEKHQSITLAGYFRRYWIDARLAYPTTSEGGCFNKTSIPEAYRNKIWTPDLYFDNADEVEYGLEGMHLQASGDIFRSTHFKGKFLCTMDFRWFPFDIQTCTMMLLSYALDASKVTLETKNGIGIILGDEASGNAEWTIIGTRTVFRQNYYTGIAWDVLYLDVQIRRDALFYVYAHMIPAALFVLVSWTGFFIDRGLAPARVAIAVIPVLSMLNLLNSIYAMVPRLSYMTWLTGYLMMCLAYTAVSAFVYGLVSYLRFQEALHKDNFQVLKLISNVLVEKEQFVHDMSKSSLAWMEAHELPVDSWFMPVPAHGDTDTKETGDMTQCSVEKIRNSREIDQANSMLPSMSKSLKIRRCYSNALTKMQHRAWTHALDVFDMKRLNKINRSRFQCGLRKFGVFYTAAQVNEIYEKLGLKDDEPMTHADFEQFLMRFHEPTMDIRKGFKDDPPSLWVDKLMRVGYITSFSMCSIGWVLALQCAP